MNRMNYEVKNEQLLIHFEGEIDSANVSYYKVKLVDAIARYNIKHLIFDFTLVDFVDSAGVGLILGRYNEMNYVKGKVSIKGLNKEMMKLMEISGVSKIITCQLKEVKI